MPTENYRGLVVLADAPPPTGAGGLAISDDFRTLADWHPKSVWVDSNAPDGAVDNADQNFYPGSMWLRTGATPDQLYVCVESSSGDARWEQIAIKKFFERQLTGGANDTIMLGTFTSAVGAGNLRLSLEANGSGYSQSAQYVIPMSYGFTGSGIWYVVNPIGASSYPASNVLAFAVDISSSGYSWSVRFRAINGLVIEAPLKIFMEYVGDSDDEFVESSATASGVTPPTQVYQPLEFLGPAALGTVGTTRIYGMNRPISAGTSYPQIAEWHLGRFETNGSALARTRLDLRLRQDSSDITNIVTFQANGRIAVGGGNTIADSVIHAKATAATDVVGIDQGAASQSENLRQGKDASGNIVYRIDKDGVFVFNEQGADADSRIEGDTDVNLFYTDAGNNRVGIGTAGPVGKLSVTNLTTADDILNLQDNGTEVFVVEDGGTVDMSGIAAGTPNFRFTATSDTPSTTWGAGAGNEVSTAPAGFLEISIGGQARYIPFWN